MKNSSLEFLVVGDFLTNLKQEFKNRNNKLIKVTELKKMKQKNKTMKNFVQKFKKVVRKSGFEGQPLIKEFKKGMNEVIWRKLMKTVIEIKQKRYYTRVQQELCNTSS